MNRSAARRIFITFFVVCTVALTYPGFVPFNRTRPLVLGLPFNLAWPLGWIVLCFLVLILLDRVLARGADRESEPNTPHPSKHS